MVTRTVTTIQKQVKMFKIYSDREQEDWGGVVSYLDRIDWVKPTEWESDEQCNQLLEESLAKYEELYKEKPYCTTSKKPVLSIYWEIVECEKRVDN